MSLVTILGWLVVVVLLPFSGFFLFITYSDWRLKRKCHIKGIPYIGTGTNLVTYFRLLSGYTSLPENEMIVYSNCAKTGAQIIGFSNAFVKLSYYVNDVDLTKYFYIKDFDHFVDRLKIGSAEANKEDLFLKMLLALNGDLWKGVRSKLSPTFTTGKIRKMFWIFEKSSERMTDYLRRYAVNEGKEIDICEAYSKYALDVIATCAFGVESNAFQGKIGELSHFEKMAQLLRIELNAMTLIKVMFFSIAPTLATKLGVTTVDIGTQEYFRKIIKEVMQQRRESGQRKEDFLQLMMDTQEGLLKEEEKSPESLEVMSGSEDGTGGFGVEASNTLKFDDEDIVANCVLFIMAGFQTTQSLLIFAAYVLALEQNVQDTLLEEVTKTMEEHGGKLEYEEVHRMQYLDMFINETLRYYSPVARNERLCTEDYKVPGMDLVIEKGSLVSLPVRGMHRDTKYYSDPEKFDPERFLPERKSQRHPYSFAPFGHGPRNCIGMRFVLTEVKTVIASLVYNFKLEPGKKTEIPVKFKNTISLRPANGMWLQITPRRQRILI